MAYQMALLSVDDDDDWWFKPN